MSSSDPPDAQQQTRPVVEEVRALVRDGGLLSDERSVIVMLSGGRDSVCLLDVCVTLCAVQRLTALHVNYGLREQAREEERYCEQLCERYDVALQVVRAPQAPAGNLQAWARKLRYDAAERAASARGGVYATGHTATDQVETILYRLAASPGRRALLGMSASEEPLIRPLLGVTREQTAAYCDALGLRWYDDESNDSDRYARGRVRRGLLPALQAVHPAALSSVLRTAQLLREETELLERLVERELDGRQTISIERLRSLPTALARLVVVRLAEDAAQDFVPQAGGRVKEILELAGRGRRSQLHVGGLVSAVVEDGALRMVKIEPHYPSSRDH
jgi:tRNA(Ile)-lysidine synthase